MANIHPASRRAVSKAFSKSSIRSIFEDHIKVCYQVDEDVPGPNPEKCCFLLPKSRE